MSVIHDASGRGISDDNPLVVRPDGSGMQPIDIQSRYASTIQTHNAVSVPATTGYSGGAWIDVDGFGEVGLTCLNDSSTANYVDLRWSNDGTNVHGVETACTQTNNRYRATSLPTKARYVSLTIGNADASAHTFSAWVYLKV